MNFRKEIRHDASRWKDAIKGETAFVLGNGPHLLDSDLSLIKDMFSIGTNRICRVFQPTILLWQDAELLKTDEESILLSHSIKLCRDISDTDRRFNHFSISNKQDRFGTDPSMLAMHGCSGALAVQVAAAMGANAIVLLGMDCDYSGGKTDFYGTNVDHKPHTVSCFHLAMKWVEKCCGVPIYNCSMAPYWPYRRLEDVIEKLQPKKKSQIQWIADIVSDKK